jgi:UDP-N-acetylglucosamine--N-acetylmuramyl-(pentapeptide) pyrophosphoryl-undecaprenol N-acetylglucosamine transferase
MVDNENLGVTWIEREVIPRVSDPATLAAMSAAASTAGARTADDVLARHVLEIVAETRR